MTRILRQADLAEVRSPKAGNCATETSFTSGSTPPRRGGLLRRRI